MNIDAFVEQCKRRGEHQRRHDELIRTLLDLRLNHDWGEIEQAVQQARYQSETVGDES